jgi:MFS transporter, UMF1 family
VLVRERGNPNPRRIFGWNMVRESTRDTLRTLRSGHEYPGLLRFLVGRVVYTDAINTVILIMALYTVNIAVASGLTEVEGEAASMQILGIAVIFAVIGGFFWGRVADRIGPKRTLDAVLFAWMGTFLLAALTGILTLPLLTLYVVACVAGFCLGGVWAADRPYMLRLTPPWRIGEFYGLYGMVGRFSAISGPATWALILYLTVQVFGIRPHVGQGLGVLVLLVQMVVSYWILRRVSDEPRDWAALAAPAGGARTPRSPAGTSVPGRTP